MLGKSHLVNWVGPVLIGVIICVLATRVVAAEANRPSMARDHVIIKFKAEIAPRFSSVPVAETLDALLSELRLPAGGQLQEPIINQLLEKAGPGQPAKPAINLHRFLYLRVPPGLTVEQCLSRLQHHPWVEYVEPDGRGTGGTTIPNDPDFSLQWYHQNPNQPSATISTPQAWDISHGSSNVLVAVLDTGLSANQAEFFGRTVPGYNFAYNNFITDDDYGHGTGVAGTLCANANNSTLLAGVDWNCRLMPIKVLDKLNSGLYSWWAQGVDFAVAHGCKVINLSAGGTTTSATLAQSITNAIAHGVIFVTITHNDGTNAIRFPGNLTDCITVGATDEMDRRCDFSNYGPEIDLVAPGVDMWAVATNGGVRTWSGTSFAAPLVAGVSALLAAVRPGITPDEVHTLLCAGADDTVGDPTDTPGFDPYYGWGRLNAFNSLLLAQTRVDQFRVLKNGKVKLSWPSPANASQKQPYQVDFRLSLTSPWIPLDPSTGFSYGTNRTYWTEHGSATDANDAAVTKFFRVRIRSF